MVLTTAPIKVKITKEDGTSGEGRNVDKLVVLVG